MNRSIVPEPLQEHTIDRGHTRAIVCNDNGYFDAEVWVAQTQDGPNGTPIYIRDPQDARDAAAALNLAANKIEDLNGAPDRLAPAYEFERLDAIAAAAPCGVDGCDGTMHDGSESPEEWWHRVHHAQFDGDAIVFDISRRNDGHYIGNIDLEGTGDMTPAELRAQADLYESYPGWLRHLADKLDTLNGVTK